MVMTGQNRFDVQEIIRIIERVVNNHEGAVALHEPYFSGNEWTYVKDCLDTGWVSSAGGTYVDRFETDLADYIGVKRAIAVVNGTAGLHIALKLIGVGFDDEVLTPNITFVATANAVVYCGAKPHLVDCDERTLGLDPEKLGAYLTDIADIQSGETYNRITGRRIKAVIAVHTFGHPVDIDPLVTVCERFNLELIEDAAESIGSFYKGRHTGNWGKLSVVSFNGNKTITTGGGGAIITNDETLGALAKHLTTTAKVPHPWEYRHDMVGYNYRMPNINAALGCAQLEQLDLLIKWKRKLAKRYAHEFRTAKGVRFFQEPPFAKSNYWLNTLVLDEQYKGFRNNLIERAKASNVITRPVWIPLHKLPMYEDCPRMELSASESLSERIVNIPSSPVLGLPYV